MKQKNKLAAVIIIVAVAVFSVAVYIYFGKPLISFVNKPQQFRAWVEKNGIFADIAFVFMVVFQIVVAIIPGEPFEIGAGYAFGALHGTLLCMIGSLIGGVTVFLISRKFGIKIVEIFVSREKIDNLKFLKYSKKRNAIMFLLFLIPGTPKDVLSYCAGITDIKLSYWIFICVVAKIPSIATSTIGGSAIGGEKYTVAIVAFAVTAVVSIVGVFAYRKITEYHNKHIEKN